MKRGQFDLSRKAVYYMLVLFVLAFIVIYMNSIIKSGNLRDVSNLGKASGSQLVAELITSPCFVLFDNDIERAYPGIIDSSRLTEESLSGCGKFFPDRFSVKINGISLGDDNFQGGHFERPVIIDTGGSLRFGEASFEVQNA